MKNNKTLCNVICNSGINALNGDDVSSDVFSVKLTHYNGFMAYTASMIGCLDKNKVGYCQPYDLLLMLLGNDIPNYGNLEIKDCHAETQGLHKLGFLILEDSYFKINPRFKAVVNAYKQKQNVKAELKKLDKLLMKCKDLS